jgi:hypothetical protein
MRGKPSELGLLIDLAAKEQKGIGGDIHLYGKNRGHNSSTPLL